MNSRLQTWNGYFYIKDFNNVHTCGAAVLTTDNSRSSSQLIGRLIRHKVHIVPLKRPVQLVRYLKEEFGVSVNYR